MGTGDEYLRRDDERYREVSQPFLHLPLSHPTPGSSWLLALIGREQEQFAKGGVLERAALSQIVKRVRL
jgi:hypothetical protein